MFSLPLFVTAHLAASSSDDEWQRLWQRRQAELVLTGITQAEHFRERINILDQLLRELIGRFRKTELVSSAVLELVAEVIQQVDTEFLGIEAWQQAGNLPNRVGRLSSIETTAEIQSCLNILRRRIRLMQILLRELEKESRLAFQYPETSEKLVGAQDEILELFQDLRKHIGKLVRCL